MGSPRVFVPCHKQPRQPRDKQPRQPRDKQPRQPRPKTPRHNFSKVSALMDATYKLAIQQMSASMLQINSLFTHSLLFNRRWRIRTWASSDMPSPAAFSSVYIASMYARRSSSTCVAFVCVCVCCVCVCVFGRVCVCVWQEPYVCGKKPKL
jgi:hypothetical protein